MKFSDLSLDNRLLKSIESLGYAEATPIQEQSFNPIVNGQDVAGLAQTGTGKTAAFLIPLIERILKSQTEPESVRAFKGWDSTSCILILVPTRELAEQIHENVKKLTEGYDIKSFPLYGGTGYDKQKEALASQLQFIVSTPGRLIDLYKEHFVDFKKVKAIVFDEADRMFDMGFKDDMKYILGRIERQRQFLVFSATLNFDVLNTAYQFGSEPVEINISKDEAKADNVQDVLIHLGHAEKPQHLISVIKKENPKQTIIFTNFKNSVDRIAHFLIKNQMPAMGISSLMSQAQRNQVIKKFKEENNQNILVATDVAARGLDISNVDLVINFELPQDSESYVHRIGRTGRAGNTGKAYSLVCDRDIESLSRIEEYTKKKIEAVFLEEAELVKEFTPLSEGEAKFKRDFNREGQGKDGKRFEGRSDKPRFSSTRSNYKNENKGSFDKSNSRGHSQAQNSESQQGAQEGQARFDRKPRQDRFDKNQKFQKDHSKESYSKEAYSKESHSKGKNFSNDGKSFEKKKQNSYLQSKSGASSSRRLSSKELAHQNASKPHAHNKAHDGKQNKFNHPPKSQKPHGNVVGKVTSFFKNLFGKKNG